MSTTRIGSFKIGSFVALAGLATAMVAGTAGATVNTVPDDPTGSAAVDASTMGSIPDAAECAAGLTLNEGVLTIATGDPAYPPYVLDDDPTSGEGFESAVAYAIADQLGFDADSVEWVRTAFDAAIAPTPKDFDFNLQQFDITPERAEVVGFSLPYYTSTQAIFGYTDSAAAEATTLADIQGLRIGVAAGTTSLVFAEEVIAPEGGVQIFNDNATAVAALDAQQIDAIVADLPTALYVTGVEMTDAAIFGQFSTTDDTAGAQWGLLFEKDNPLIECVDYALMHLSESGELAAITDEWMSSSVEVPYIDVDG